MEKNNNEPAVPEQQVGGETNIDATEECESVAVAIQLFNEAKQRLLEVNKWHQLCGALSADFQLTDKKGNKVDRMVAVDDRFQIDIPGPGSAAGKGYDWVRVEKIEEEQNADDDTESVIIRVRPTDNPTTSNDDVAHFFSEDATSNFIVTREKQTVTAAVRGRNEVPNTKTSTLIDKARNAIIGTSAITGLSSPQWSRLAHALLGK